MNPVEVLADPKPRKRIVATASGYAQLRETLKELFPACGVCARYGQTNHHVVPRSQGGDDVLENMVRLCGHGTAGCHGDVEHRRNHARERLREYLELIRPEVIEYAIERKGSVWVAKQYPRRPA